MPHAIPQTRSAFYPHRFLRQWWFAVRALIAQARLFENFLKLKTRQVYFIYPFPRRMKLEKALKTCRVNFFLLNGHFNSENSVFWKASFLQNKKWFAYKFRIQHFEAGKNFSFNQCHKQSVFLFFSGKLFYKSNRKFLSCVYIAWNKHSRGRENSRQLFKSVSGLHNCLAVPPTPLVFF